MKLVRNGRLVGNPLAGFNRKSIENIDALTMQKLHGVVLKSESGKALTTGDLKIVSAARKQAGAS